MKRFVSSRISGTMTAAWLVSGFAAMLSLPASVESESRTILLPKLQAGRTLRYDIHARIQRHVKTESRVSTLLATPDLQKELSIQLLLSVEQVRMERGRPIVVARADMQSENDSPAGNTAPATPKVEFTLLGDGEIARVDGLDDLDPEMRLAWQFWIARFAYGWTLPPGGMKRGERWKSDEAEKTPAPIANLVWERENTYVEDGRCPVIPAQTCASFLTHATLKQKSSPKDSTPEDYKLHELKTAGTAQGTNETITYISLKTGLVLRATEDAKQTMDVTIQKSDGSNGVHYTIDASSHFETILVSSKP